MPRRQIRRTVALLAALALAVPLQVQAASADIPGWLEKHVGTGEGQIAPIVLQRARALYQKGVRDGSVRNGCYLAMDATRPHTRPDGNPADRFYVICEAQKSFRAVSSGHGDGRKLPKANFANGRQCARHFSNAEGSKLTMGGAYTTAEARTSFKGYYKQSGQMTPFNRTFIQFNGMGETANAREREIGGHMATLLRWQCRMKAPDSPYADKQGYVPVGKLVNYFSGRSNGCTTWTSSASQDILSLIEKNPTTLYIYPESGDIAKVAKAVQKRQSLAGAGLYWNADCLKAIGTPQFWPKRKLEPVIDRWRQSLPKQPPLELPLCQ